ncbi:hypothetical protein [Methylorubrum extorquens]|uniref:Uncharacterized protein n=1 Tax=Methylorubrum extorquens (strain ATCC 14718 / DSM 1338 / JCM 2805 / NCIMB 9133 / AM1) TaxID=272630 RepID=C5APF6_METEA|nr:hypothetical protein [Methylorubrum extorquens]ACS38041.1 hypothetical protein MexAM1_META1p0073 [Methylorubrum extorquens AM1]MCP1543915.1 hypothetical protein [Methylorubrum extorquens]MCP1588739.1 hypothetical protein [Methylorubrum extorquens]
MPQSSTDRAFRLGRLYYPQYPYNLQHQLKAEAADDTGQGKGGFERQRAVRLEDRERREALLSWADGTLRLSAQRPVKHYTAHDARELAMRLKRPARGGPPAQTFASAAYMRRFRLRFVGAVLRLIRENPTAEVGLVTIIPRDWRIRGRDLPTIKPKQYLERFRQQLVRAGLKEADGWLIAFLHGDYDPSHDTYQLHLHVVATGGLVPLIRQLNALPVYRRGDPTASGFVRQPIRVLRLKDPERRVSYYLGQAFWPSKPSYVQDGVWRRHPRRQRIPNPRLAEWLMWIDRQSFSDLLMLRGCRLGDGTLMLQRNASRTA